MTINPARGYLIVELIKTTMSPGGIELPMEPQTSVARARVLDCGPSTKDELDTLARSPIDDQPEIGDIVYFDPRAFRQIDRDKGFLHRSQVWGVSESLQEKPVNES